MRSLKLFILLLGLFIFVLSGCGGGGDGGIAPVANAGPDKAVATGTSVNFDGSSSAAADGGALNYAWSIAGKPAGSSASVSNATAVIASLVPDVAGSYTIQLIVNDGTVDSSADTLTVSAFTPTSRLSDTGQTDDYTATFGEDSDYTINPPLYTPNDDGTVTDNVTGLMWQQQDDDTTRTWGEATTYCTDLTLTGYTDWRLPNNNELATIIDYGADNPPIDITAFPGTNTSEYWSSATSALSPSHAWYGEFIRGEFSIEIKTESYYVRCVRGEPLSFGNFNDNGDSTISDSVTGLMWQKTNGGGMNWEAALTYCEGLGLAGHSDWRLPNIKDLASIVDYTKSSPAIDTSYFPGTSQVYYWTSTTNVPYPVGAWAVDFMNGWVFWLEKVEDSIIDVRCVR